jgi:hypothetical protein
VPASPEAAAALEAVAAAVELAVALEIGTPEEQTVAGSNPAAGIPKERALQLSAAETGKTRFSQAAAKQSAAAFEEEVKE